MEKLPRPFVSLLTLIIFGSFILPCSASLVLYYASGTTRESIVYDERLAATRRWEAVISWAIATASNMFSRLDFQSFRARLSVEVNCELRSLEQLAVQQLSIKLFLPMSALV